MKPQAIDSNEACVQKFEHLRGYLLRQTEKCIEGFILTNNNYRRALTFWESSQPIIHANLRQLMKTAPVKERNIPRLRNLQETTEGQLRVLTNR